MAVILAIDDSLTDLTMIQYILSSHQVLVASDGQQGLQMLSRHPETDLILLDLRMPVMDGFSFLDKMSSLGLDTPVIILTNSEEVDKEILGLDKGAVDFIRKPLNFQALKKRIDVQLRLKQATEQIRQHNRHLEDLVQQRTAEIRRTNEITINALVRLLEIRNIETSNHSRRTKIMMQMLCEALQNHPKDGYQLSERDIQELVETAPLHDIGKVGIPDNILLKPGRLEQAEIVIMREHVLKGVEALDYSLETDDAKISFIETARELIASHHEWFDGSGYPNGLDHDNIPLSGRLMAVIDVYDALTSKRVYKEAMSHKKTLEVMQSEAERHFDPVIFQTFLSIADTIHDQLKQD
ncbi:putative cyclic di-GMP phosphodiesterase [bioreactor metagenome]|uniref:Putative cyclic di-GMP phosphodiesterase n=1 Tax=bioreactor metagenome TaxID=1076179 RepID=A0A645DBJ6_9ZZZZ|nr:response regulator [Sphaerochaeta sp.]